MREKHVEGPSQAPCDIPLLSAVHGEKIPIRRVINLVERLAVVNE